MTDTGADWPMYGRTTDEQRFSPLTQINEQNVDRLGLVWSRELGTTHGLEATPIVSGGVIYTTSQWSVAYALDAKTGKILWAYDPQVSRAHVRTICCDTVNRGVALSNGKVYLGTLDGRLIALDAKTGKPVWDVVTVDQSKPYAITGAPRVVKGMVLIGNAGSEFGVRGYLSAYDGETGKLKWRSYTVPGDPAKGFESTAMEEAAKTWHGQWWVAGGGGTIWDAIVYDPDLDLIYAGTGNGTAWYRDLRSPGGGDNLYIASILAFRPETGELVWHYQVTPGENWDYDATQPLMLADLKIAGTPRKVIMQASKNGFFYVLDRQTGQFLSAKPFVDEVTWATGIDPKSGRPIESPAAYDGMRPVLVSPAPGGAHNWYPMAFDPRTSLVYIPARQGSFALHAPDKNWTSNTTNWNRGEDDAYQGPLLAKLIATPPMKGMLIAWDPVQQRQVWRVSFPMVESGGVLATAGNLILQGRSDGVFCVYRAKDGKQLWQFDAGTGIMAAPVTYLLDGVQYVTLMVGWGGAAGLNDIPGSGVVKPGFGRVLTFALGGQAKLEVPPFGYQGEPSPAIHMKTTPAMIREGDVLFARHCFYCHGVNAISSSGVPDLRYASAATHHQFESIVLGGARQQMGMPSFKDALTPDQVRAIEAYVLARASLGQ
ncbi:MAG TPA: PQQ-dependent dehydrogenase, methanol/ethanol family [Acidobacteriaceae bacterium]|nr:PQQ-dependent dehydrogenase, methanol/ethanol family [Acidobacteriaceae bacterium]